MNKVLADLVKLLQLEPLEVNLFRGESRSIGSPNTGSTSRPRMVSSARSWARSSHTSQ